jgi:hypothetical protein
VNFPQYLACLTPLDTGIDNIGTPNIIQYPIFNNGQPTLMLFVYVSFLSKRSVALQIVWFVFNEWGPVRVSTDDKYY